MSLQEQIAQDLAALFEADEFAREVSYIVKLGATKSIRGILGPINSQQYTDAEGTRTIKRCELVILTDEAKGIAAPSGDDTVQIDSVTWQIEDIENEGFGKAVLKLVWDQVTAKHSDKFKRRL